MRQDILTIHVDFATNTKALGKEMDATLRRAGAETTRGAERQRRFALDGIRLEAQQRRRAIESEYEYERQTIRRLTKERVAAREITAGRARRQMQEAETGLAGVRRGKLAGVAGDVLGGNPGRLVSALGLDAGALGSFAGVAAGATAGVAALGAGLVLATRQAMDFEAQMNTVGRTTGLSGAALDALGADLLDLSVRLGVSQTDLLGIAETAGSLGIVGKDNILGFTEAAQMFALAADMNATEAADALAKVSSAFGVPIEQAQNLGSAIDAMADTTAARSQDVAAALLLVGAAGRQAGMTADQVAAISATLIDAGVDASTAGTSIRNVLTLMQTEAEKVGKTAGMTGDEWLAAFSADPLKALNTYLDALRKLPPTVQAIQVEAAFGRENVVAVQTLAGQTDTLTEALASSAKAFEEGTRLSGALAQRQTTTAAQFDILKARVGALATEMGGPLNDALGATISGLNDLLGGSARAESNLAALRNEAGRVGEIEELSKRYTDLASKQSLTSEETDELRRLTERLSEAFPSVFAAYDGATSKAGAYTSELWRQVAALRARNAEEMAAGQRSAFEGFQRGLGEERQGRQLATTGAYRITNTNAGGTMMPVVDRAAGALAIAAGQRKQMEAVKQLEAAGVDFSTGPITAVMRVVEAAKRAGAALTMVEANALARIGFDQSQKRTQVVPAAPAPTPSTVTTPAATSTRERGGATRERGNDAARDARQREEAERSITADVAQMRADADADELRRSLETIRLRADAERAALRESAAEASKGATEAQTAAIAASLSAGIEASETRQRADEANARTATRERIAREADADQQIADERARLNGATETDLLTARVARIEAEIAAEVDSAERRAGLERDLARTRIALDKQVADARAAKAEQTESKVRAAKEKTAKATADEAEKARRKLEEETAQYEQIAARAFDVVIAAFGDRQDRMSEARQREEGRRFDEQEAALRQSLSKREISQAVFNDRMAILAEERASFEKTQVSDTARVTGEVLLGLVGIVREVAIEQLKAQLVPLAGLAIRRVMEGPLGGLAGALGPFGIAALAGTTIAAVWGLEKVIRSQAGFASGGYTGAGGRYDVAGQVHRGEVVMEAPIVRGQEREWMQVRRMAQQGITPREMLDAVQMRAATRPAFRSGPSPVAMPDVAREVAEQTALTRQVARAQELTLIKQDGMMRRLEEAMRTPPPVIVTPGQARIAMDAARRESARRQTRPSSIQIRRR